MFFWCLCPLFPYSSSKLSSVWVLLATWLRFSLQKCMLAARKTYPLTFSSYFLWKAQVSFSLTVKNMWRGKGKRTSSLCRAAERSYFHPLHQTFHVALFALCSVPSGKRSGRKTKCADSLVSLERPVLEHLGSIPFRGFIFLHCSFMNLAISKKQALV